MSRHRGGDSRQPRRAAGSGWAVRCRRLVGRADVRWLAVAVLLGGCAQHGTPQPQAGQAGETRTADIKAWNVRCAAADLDGRVYATVGRDRYEAVLVDVQLCPLQLTRIAEAAPLYEVSAGGGVVAVGGGHVDQELLQDMGLPGPSRVSLFRDGQVTDIPGLGSPRGGSISVSAEGMIAFGDVREKPGRITTWHPRDHKAEVVAIDDELSHSRPAWGPDGALAVHRPSNGTHVVTVYGSEGFQVEAEYDTGLSEVRRVKWWPGELAVISPPGTGVDCCQPDTPRERAVLMDMTSGQVVGHLPRGWQGVAWSPDGERLLVVRGPEVGITRLGDDEVTVLGPLPDGGLHDAAWIE